MKKMEADGVVRHMTDLKRMEEPTGENCEKCGKPMVIKWGKFGKFIACSGCPECSNTRELPPDPASTEGITGSNPTWRRGAG